MSSPRQRLLVSFAVSPLVALPVTACTFVLFELWLRFPGRVPAETFQLFTKTVFHAALMAPLVAYPVMLVLGIPISLALRKLNLFRPLMMVPLGALAGAVPFLFLTVRFSAPLLVVGALNGAVTAWLVWRISSGEPDRFRIRQVQA